MKFFDTEGSMRTMTVEDDGKRGLRISNNEWEFLFSLYNEGNGAIRLKLLDGAKVLTYDGCADGKGVEFRIGK